MRAGKATSVLKQGFPGPRLQLWSLAHKGLVFLTSVFLGLRTPTHDTGALLPRDVTSEKISEKPRRASPQVAQVSGHVDQAQGSAWAIVP